MEVVKEQFNKHYPTVKAAVSNFCENLKPLIAQTADFLGNLWETDKGKLALLLVISFLVIWLAIRIFRIANSIAYFFGKIFKLVMIIVIPPLVALIATAALIAVRSNIEELIIVVVNGFSCQYDKICLQVIGQPLLVVLGTLILIFNTSSMIVTSVDAITYE
eukprot:TRINITY_DN141526_c0_g1_i1.p1 TRINITY_DN141526_c0_g1~~TRINITY_DN141526_c0_g1_i1.p1  ORF type:complete len:162 (-),score=30.47 TRINITY_DN141526_c0_g1_i1:47-532(-)